jgi:hypothetical protein
MTDVGTNFTPMQSGSYLSKRPCAVVRSRFCVITLLMVCGLAMASATNSTHWAFQPLVRPPLPSIKYSNPIDASVFSKLSKKNGALDAEADRRTLIRRLSFDLRGLPPSPEEVSDFLKDNRANAFEKLVEDFLSSPRYGERWGRHWLDIVGYADSNGYFNADSDRPLAWKFRDYVVRSMNADKPLDFFIHEQIAGDELVGYVAGGDVTPEMVEPLIATHFWRNAPDGTTESDGNPLEVKVDKYAVLEGNVQNLGSAFLGVTLQCARCHDHKFEPITQAEYYSLQAILRPAFDPDRWLKPNERAIEVGSRSERDAHQRLTAEVERDVKTLKESLEGLTALFRKQFIDENLATLNASMRKAIQEALDTKEKQRTEAMKSLLKTNATLVDIKTDALEKKFPAFAAAAEPLRETIKKRESEKPAPLEKLAATFEPANSRPVHHLLVRGSHANEGREIPPGIPAILNAVVASNQTTSGEFAAFSDSSTNRSNSNSSHRRLALAYWLTSPTNPIVARVLVNRIWNYHFGQGLVSTLDNLGQSGERPVYPELLDWLASEFIGSGWSLKHLHRLILNSATWKQACADVENRSPMIRSQPLRLDAESLRDAMLTVSGEIDLTSGGSYVPTTTDKQGQVIIDEKQAGAYRRSIYLQQRRTAPVSFLSSFDGPAHNPVCVQRVSSTVALQSLFLLNSEFVQLRARSFAKRILACNDLAAREVTNEKPNGSRLKSVLRLAFELAYNRPPMPRELSAAKSFIKEQRVIYQGQPDAAVRIWTDFCQMLLASNAFLYVD